MSGGNLGTWTPPPAPVGVRLAGRHVRLEPLGLDHAEALHTAFTAPGSQGLWTYMPSGPFASAAEYAAWVAGAADSADPAFLAILVEGRPVGVAAWLRATPAMGTIEVGYITYAPALQRTRAATEAMTLMAGWAFDAGYRRYEWKCNARNVPSRRAAERLGFSFEGVFRQHMIVKGQSRDTAWFAMTDGDWACISQAHHDWLDPDNFDAEGRQKCCLGAMTTPCRVASDPSLQA